jgi:hypothetical protein
VRQAETEIAGEAKWGELAWNWKKRRTPEGTSRSLRHQSEGRAVSNTKATCLGRWWTTSIPAPDCLLRRTSDRRKSFLEPLE